MELAPVNSNTAKVQYQEGVDANAEVSTESVATATQAVTPLLRNNITVDSVSGAGNTARTVDVPELDASKATGEENLDKLIALLMLESDNAQIESAKERLESMYDKLDAQQEEVLKSLSEALEEAKELEAEQKKQEALGWLMLAISVIATVVSSIATFGAASAGVAAIIGCCFSIAATTLTAVNQIATAAGGRDAYIEAEAERMMEDDPSLSKKDAKKKAGEKWDQGWAIAQAVCGLGSLVCGCVSIGQTVKAFKSASKAVVEVAQTAGKATSKLSSKGVQAALRITSTALQLASSATGVAQGALQLEIAKLMEEAQLAEAELAELKAFLDMIEQMIDEQEEMLQELLTMLQDSLAFLSEVTNAQTNAVSSILDQYGAGGAV